MRPGKRGQHSGSSLWWSRRWAAGAAVLVVGALVAGGLVLALHKSGPSKAEVAAKQAAQAAQVAQAHQAAVQLTKSQMLAGLTISPAANASGVAPDATVSVSTTVGAVKAVTVSVRSSSASSGSTLSSAATLTGHLNSAATKWVSAGALQPSTTYQVTATLVGPGGVTAEQTSTFATLTPTEVVHASLWPTVGMSVGVGEPIVVTFDHDISSTTAQKAVISHLTVAMSTPVPGGWYWFSKDELHFRPESFWPAHEQVEVSADLDGWDAGSGAWGSGQQTDSFGIGDARVSYANLQSEVMTVTVNGATVSTYPISGGRPEYPTMNGTHIVLDRESVVHMVSSTVGIPVNSPNGYDELVYNDVHISDSGEYVHAAPWSVGEQGHENVSHGCINLSNANSLSFFNLSRVGDVVEVTGSSRPPAAGDHGVMDWTTPWSDWIPAHVGKIGGSSTSAAASSPSSTVATTTTVAPAVAVATTVPVTAAPTTTAPTTVPKPTTTATTTPKPTTTTTVPKTTTTTKP